jgi:hypothetical protein
MAWRLARGLDKLRSQVNAKYPNRSRKIDGTIGDAKHSARASDHNPRGGIVHAWDVTHSPATGFDAHAFAERLRTARDPRISYVISNARIFSSTKSPWVWRKYGGSNPHRSHVHVSIRGNPHADSTKDWSGT